MKVDNFHIYPNELNLVIIRKNDAEFKMPSYKDNII